MEHELTEICPLQQPWVLDCSTEDTNIKHIELLVARYVYVYSSLNEGRGCLLRGNRPRDIR